MLAITKSRVIARVIIGVAGAGQETDEDSAYAVVFTVDTNTWKSECLVFKADDISEPIARVKIPRRVATGFHTTWVPGHLFWH